MLSLAASLPPHTKPAQSVQATAIEATFRGHYCYTYYNDLRAASSVIQRAWRSVIGHRVQRWLQQANNHSADTRWSAAAAIQRAWRGFAARTGPAAAQRQRNAALSLAAIRVQVTWYKRNRLFSAFVLMRSLVAQHDKDVAQQKHCRSSCRADAACKIQSSWRGLVARRRVAYVSFRIRCACRLQAWRRQCVWERRLRQFWTAVHSVLLHTRCARSVQGWWWRRKPGRLLASLKVRPACDRTPTHSCVSNATTDTSSVCLLMVCDHDSLPQARRYRRDAEALRARALLEDQSATKIQALVRGVAGRRCFKQHYCAREIQVPAVLIG
jgi:hypothetical protein